MSIFLIAAASFVMLTVAVGLLRILRGAGDADRVMAAQLLGTGGVATLLLASVGRSAAAVTNVALVLALLAAFATVAFVKNATPTSGADAGDDSAL